MLDSIYKLVYAIIAALLLNSCAGMSLLGIAEEAGERVVEDVVKQETGITIPLPKVSPTGATK